MYYTTSYPLFPYQTQHLFISIVLVYILHHNILQCITLTCIVPCRGESVSDFTLSVYGCSYTILSFAVSFFLHPTFGIPINIERESKEAKTSLKKRKLHELIAVHRNIAKSGTIRLATDFLYFLSISLLP